MASFMSKRWNIAIVGAGKVGSVLGKLLQQNGDKIVCVVSRSKASAQKAGKFLKCSNTSTSLDAIPANTDLVFITTPHDAIHDVALSLASAKKLNFKNISVCHASGMLTADVLDPLKQRGATVFSFHPLQTFPRDFKLKDILESVHGIYYGVDGSPKALRVAGQLARKLDGKVIAIPKEMRPFYHAACVVASNHLTAMLWLLSRMFAEMGGKAKDFYPVFMPIIMATLENIERTSPAKALSGPVARGGIETVTGHLEYIKKITPDLLPYFATLTIETAKLALAKGSIDDSKKQALIDLAHSFMRTNSHLKEIN